MHSFEVGNQIIVSDPCYKGDTLDYCAAIIKDCVPGKWFGKAELIDEHCWGMRCKELYAFHENFAGYMHYFQLHEKEICVDSGQAGIFDAADFIKHQDERDYGSGDWYSQMCDLTGKHYGSYEHGIVSSSGFGDGSYSLYYAADNNGRVCALKIVFIDDEERDEYDEEDGEW